MNEKDQRYDEIHRYQVPEWTKEQKKKQAGKDFLSFTGRKMRH